MESQEKVPLGLNPGPITRTVWDPAIVATEAIHVRLSSHTLVNMGIGKGRNEGLVGTQRGIGNSARHGIFLLAHEVLVSPEHFGPPSIRCPNDFSLHVNKDHATLLGEPEVAESPTEGSPGCRKAGACKSHTGLWISGILGYGGGKALNAVTVVVTGQSDDEPSGRVPNWSEKWIHLNHHRVWASSRDGTHRAVVSERPAFWGPSLWTLLLRVEG